MNPYIRMLKMLLLLFIFYLTYHDNKGIHWVTESGITVTSNPSKTFLQRRRSRCVCVGGNREDRREGKLNRLEK